MLRTHKIVAALTALAFCGNCLAQALPPESTNSTETSPQTAPQAEGKFVWGILIKLAAPYVLEYFSTWAKKKIVATHNHRPSMDMLAGNAHFAYITNLSKYFASKSSTYAGAAPNAAIGTPDTPLRTDRNGENFQGVNVALVGIDEHAQPTGFRTVADGFKSGERFKLRVLSTFDALVVLGNITPKGAQRQIYPADSRQAVWIPAGREILLPLNAEDYLQFTGDTGRDQLTFTVRDPRTLKADQASSAKVFRKDEDYGSNFVQEVKPDQYPVIAEAIGIEHR